MPGKVVELGGIAEVGGGETGPAALAVDGAGYRPATRGVTPVRDDVGAAPAELHGGRLADSRSGACDKRRDALEVSLFAHVLLPPISGPACG